MSRVLVAVVVLAALLAGALWYVTSSRSISGTAAAGEVVEAAPVERERQELAAPRSAEVAETDEPRSPTSGAREAAPTPRDEWLASAHWVEGRVVFPPRTPPDEEVFVVAEGSSVEEHRAKVAADGAFRVAFDEDTKVGSLRVDGRYLWLREEPTWKPGTSEPIVLEPELGGRIVARVVAPDGAGAPPEGEVQLALHSTGGMRQEVEKRPLGPELEVAFDALIAERRYGVGFDGKELVGAAEDTPAAGETHTVVLELLRGVRLAGRVVDERGEQLEGAWVQAHGMHHAYSVGNVRGEKTAADGTFALDALFAGTIMLTTSLGGRVTSVLELGKIEDGTRRSDVEIVLTSGGSIAGIVTWPDGTPAEADIEVEPYGDPLQAWQHMQVVRSKSDADGRFRVTGLAAEEFLVRARATTKERVDVVDDRGRERKVTERRRFSAEIARVDSGAEDLRLVLSAGLALAGRVVDDRGVPLDDFQVSASRASTTGMSIYVGRRAEVSGSYRDAGGAFELEGFAPGEWLVEASAKGHARSAQQRVTVPDARLHELVAPREARVTGVVLDVDGEPCADAEIEVERPEERNVSHNGAAARSDSKGAFELDGLAPGRVVVVARSQVGTTSEPLELELVPGETVADVVLRLRAGATVTGEVVDREGRPVVGVQVHVGTSDSASYRPPHTTDATGRFEARGLPPGRAHVYAMDVDGMQVSRFLTLSEGDSAHVVLAPPKTASVRLNGRITADGEPLARARIGANFSGPPPADGGAHVSSNATADADGRYEVMLPGPGVYGIWVHGGSSQQFNWSTSVDVPPVAELAFDVAIPLGRISGRVTRTTGEPLEGVWVHAQSARVEGPGGHGGGSGGGRAETDGDGRYELLLPTGTYTVTAGGDRRGFGTELEVVAGVVKELVLDAGGHLRGIDFELASGGVLLGEVTAPAGVDANGTAVWSRDRWLTQCENGSFRVGALARGTHEIRVTGQRVASDWIPVDVEVGETTRVRIDLEPCTMIRARVRDASGAPVDCPIGAVDADGNQASSAPAGKPGEAYVRWLTRGRYTVRAYCDGKVAERTVEVAGTEPTIEVELRLE